MKFSIESAREASRAGNFCVSVLNYLTVLRMLPSESRKKYVKEFCVALNNVVGENSEFCKDKGLVFALSRDLFGSLEIAEEAFRYCKDDEQYLNILVNAENIKSHMFDQWHWAMLSDERRNRSYSGAISLAIGQNSEWRVLDIGGGTALLSIFASRYSNHIYCCEMSENMCCLAEKIIKGNNKIRLIRKHSLDLNLEHLDFQRVDVVVTETMDSGLFGERIITSLLDAHRRLMKKESFVLPCKATVFGVLVECEQIFLENVSVKSNIRFVSHFIKCGPLTPKEPYCCAYMNEVKGGYVLLTEPIKLLEVDFNDTNCLQLLQNGFTATVSMVVQRKGTVNAIVTWFSCELFPGVQLLSSDPEANSCWQQAIFPLPVELSVDAGDRFPVAAHVCEDRFSCELLNLGSIVRLSYNKSDVSKCSTVNQALTVSDHYLKKLHNTEIFRTNKTMNGQCLGVDDNLIPLVVLENTDFFYLNDYALEDFFFNSFLNVFQPSYRVVDLTNLSSVSLKLESSHCFYNARCIYYDPDYQIVMQNCSDSKRNTLLPLNNTEFPCEADIVLFWPINSSGFLNEVPLNQIVDMKIINTNVIVIPACIKVIGCVVSCPSVTKRSKLGLDVCVGADLSHARDLAVSYYYDIEVKFLLYLNFQWINSTELPQFLQQLRRQVQLKITSDGLAGGILFWFNASFRSHNYCAAAKDTNARCAIFVFKQEKYVHCGETLTVNTSLYHGNFVIEE
uniref:Protein arginine N-methyltransferase 9-like n=1 Tax=Syphacia muris TaxID=451379 RepID=A0A0N5AYM0_9BILA